MFRIGKVTDWRTRVSEFRALHFDAINSLSAPIANAKSRPQALVEPVVSIGAARFALQRRKSSRSFCAAAVIPCYSIELGRKNAHVYGAIMPAIEALSRP
jgi:hypothetical protein